MIVLYYKESGSSVSVIFLHLLLGFSRTFPVTSPPRPLIIPCVLHFICKCGSKIKRSRLLRKSLLRIRNPRSDGWDERWLLK